MSELEKFLDTEGRPLTQSIFLELTNEKKYAVYTLKERDHEVNGKVYPSIKRLYMEMEDPTEYFFATKYFYSYAQWQRICENAMLLRHIEKWREELEVKIASTAIRDMMNLCTSENGNFSAAKWLADRSWNKREVGRPSKKEKERQSRIDQRIADEFSDDARRLQLVKSEGTND